MKPPASPAADSKGLVMLADRIPASEVRRLRALRGEVPPRWRDVIAEAAVVFLVGCIGSFALGVVYFEALR